MINQKENVYIKININKNQINNNDIIKEEEQEEQEDIYDPMDDF